MIIIKKSNLKGFIFELYISHFFCRIYYILMGFEQLVLKDIKFKVDLGLNINN